MRIQPPLFGPVGGRSVANERENDAISSVVLELPLVSLFQIKGWILHGDQHAI